MIHELLKLLAVIATTAWLAASLYAGVELQNKTRGLEACKMQSVQVPMQILKPIR